jgi:hypothetical protein
MHVVHLPLGSEALAPVNSDEPTDDMGEKIEEQDGLLSLEIDIVRRQRGLEQLLTVMAARLVAAEGMLRALGVRMDWVEEKLGSSLALALALRLMVTLSAPISPWW